MTAEAVFRRAFEQALGPAAKSPPLLILRRKGCGCRIGAVHRVGDRYVMAGRRSFQVYVSETAWRPESAWFLVADLDSPEQPEAYGCHHGQGLLDMMAIATAVRSTTRLRSVYVVG